MSAFTDAYRRAALAAGGGGAGFGIGSSYDQIKNQLLYKELYGGGSSSSASASGGGNSGNTQSTSTSSSESKSSSFSGIEDADTRALLKELINQMNTGGTAGQKEAKAAKQETIGKLDAALLDYSKRAAFQDAVDLMNLNISKSMEANKPAIQRAVEGAGTSAGSMQALLSQRLAADSSMQAGALGAEQAKAYGNIAAALLSQRGSLTKGVDDTTAPMLQAIDLLKVARSQSESKSSSSQTGYFSPQQMNVETQADKLAQIALQNQGAFERAQLAANAQSSALLASQASQASIQDPLSLMRSLGYGNETGTSLSELMRLATKGAPAAQPSTPSTTSPSYMSQILSTGKDVNNWYPSTYEYI